MEIAQAQSPPTGGGLSRASLNRLKRKCRHQAIRKNDQTARGPSGAPGSVPDTRSPALSGKVMDGPKGRWRSGSVRGTQYRLGTPVRDDGSIPVSGTPDITSVLQQARQGDPGAERNLETVIYRELHAIAAHYFRGQPADHTLQATALVNEAYLRLIDRTRVETSDTRHFVALAARAMRSVLVDHARRRDAAKRGGGHKPLPLGPGLAAADPNLPDLLELDLHLEALAAIDPTMAQIVELRYFGGMTMEEISILLNTSKPTIERRWRTARAWLYQRLHSEGDSEVDTS